MIISDRVSPVLNIVHVEGGTTVGGLGVLHYHRRVTEGVVAMEGRQLGFLVTRFLIGSLPCSTAEGLGVHDNSQ